MMPNKKAAQAGTRTASTTTLDHNNSPKNIRPPFWLPFNVESYRADTADLSTVEHGAFLLLRLHYWRSGPPRDDNKILARIAGLSITEWRRVRPSLERFFDIADEWINWDWDEELEKAYAHIQKASAAAKKGADARWAKERNRLKNNFASDTPGMRSASDSDTEGFANYKSGGVPPEPPPDPRG